MVPLRITIYKTKECQFQFIMNIHSNQNLPDLRLADTIRSPKQNGSATDHNLQDKRVSISIHYEYSFKSKFT